jgi:integrase
VWYSEVPATMRLHFGSAITMKLRYVYSRNGILQYQRKVPLDLVDRYGSKLIKINLGTSDPYQAMRKVEALNQRFEREWSAMREDSEMTPSKARAGARVLLKQYGLMPYPKPNPESYLDAFFGDLESKRDSHARGDEDRYDDPVQDYLKPTEVAALELLNRKPELLLSEAVGIYLDGHKNANVERFRKYTYRIWKTLADAIGDKPFMEVSRADANAYRDYVLSRGNKTTTVRRQVNVIRAVFAVVIQERELNKVNPWNALRIAGLGDDAEERTPFTGEEMVRLKAAVVKTDDDMRWILGLQSDTGMRVAEAVGLALDDIVLDGPVPYLNIRVHPWRRLKDPKTSTRMVPLVGTSLWAAQRVLETAKEGQTKAFPRYTSGTQCKADSASANLNDWMKSRGIPHTTHEFRHTLRDRLRAVGCTKDVMDAIGGWGVESIGDTYGHGYALSTMHEWLKKIV